MGISYVESVELECESEPVTELPPLPHQLTAKNFGVDGGKYVKTLGQWVHNWYGGHSLEELELALERVGDVACKVVELKGISVDDALGLQQFDEHLTRGECLHVWRCVVCPY